MKYVKVFVYLLTCLSIYLFIYLFIYCIYLFICLLTFIIRLSAGKVGTPLVPHHAPPRCRVSADIAGRCHPSPGGRDCRGEPFRSPLPRRSPHLPSDSWRGAEVERRECSLGLTDRCKLVQVLVLLMVCGAFWTMSVLGCCGARVCDHRWGR